MRTAGAFGELVLRTADDGHHEVISNGTFLMDTRDGRSERGLASEALAVARADGPPLHVLVAGLGVGFTLGAALASPRVDRVTVVEVEPRVVELVRHTTGVRTGGDVTDDRVAVVVGDLHAVLRAGALPAVDVLCLDVDNGPGWTVGDGNARLYDDEGVALLASALAPHGVLAVWSAHHDQRFAARLATRFEHVRTRTWSVPRGEPDVVWVATGAR